MEFFTIILKFFFIKYILYNVIKLPLVNSPELVGKDFIGFLKNFF